MWHRGGYGCSGPEAPASRGATHRRRRGARGCARETVLGAGAVGRPAHAAARRGEAQPRVPRGRRAVGRSDASGGADGGRLGADAAGLLRHGRQPVDSGHRSDVDLRPVCGRPAASGAADPRSSACVVDQHRAGGPGDRRLGAALRPVDGEEHRGCPGAGAQRGRSRRDHRPQPGEGPGPTQDRGPLPRRPRADEPTRPRAAGCGDPRAARGAGDRGWRATRRTATS